MFFNLLTWLDSSPAHYWSVAWTAFGSVLAMALLAVFFPRDQAWWQHPVLFSVAMLMALLAFRWPVLLDNRQYPDPDESQMIAGASTLRHDPVFWRSVDGLTHGPLDQWPLLLALFVRGRLDFTTARTVSTLLLWISLVSVWLIFRHLYQASVAGLLVLPLLAVHAFTHAWSFVAYCSEHVPDTLLAVACWLLLTAWRPCGAGPPSLGRLFAAGVFLGAVPFAKLQAVPVAAIAVVGGDWFVLASGTPNWRSRYRALVALLGGAVTVPLIIVSTVLASGVWSEFFRGYILNNIQQVGANKFPPDRSFAWTEGPRTLVDLGGSIFGFNEFFLWLVAFGVCGLLFAWWFTRWHRRWAAFAILMLLAAAFAAIARGRPYLHYLQLIIFPTAFFAGVIVGALLQAVDRRAFITAVPRRLMRSVVLVAFLSCGLVPQIWWRVREPQPFIGQFAATHGELAQSEVSREILRHATPGERLGMWGWMPVFWVETGLIQATRDGNCSYQIEPHQQRNYYRERFLHDFLVTQPPVFVDAVGPGNFVYEDRAESAHETFPELREYITDNYRLVRDVEGTRIYVRNDRL